MTKYSDWIDRILRAEGLLRSLFPKDISDRELWRRLNDADDATLAGGRIGVPQAFAVVRGGLLYALDDLDGCSEFFQNTANDLVGYWHGMKHRREADFDNARYWFRRTGTLPFFDTLHSRVSGISTDAAKQFSWDPYLFTGACEQHRFGDDSEVRDLARLQRAEFDVVFDYTWRQAKVGPLSP
ncbi:MAG TPA: hypothetical protein VFR18_12975 [Terriglobia bacterium]|nr:hypothetical protein [Terriglobia bacterium]